MVKEEEWFCDEKVMPETSIRTFACDSGGVLSEDVQFYKAQFEALKANVHEILVKQAEFDKFMTYSMSQQQSQGESWRLPELSRFATI